MARLQKLVRMNLIKSQDGFTEFKSWIVDFQNGMADHAKNKSRLATLMINSDSN